MSSNVAIFRKRLLPYSETFIADQGQCLPTYSPIFCGYEKEQSGLGLIQQSPKALLCDYSTMPNLAKFLFRQGFSAAPKWLNTIREFEPALIHAHFLKDGIEAMHIGRKIDRPVVTTLHGHDITKAGKTEKSRKSLRQFFDRVDRVIAVSDYIANEALSRGCPEDKLIQHYIGIDLQRFSHPKKESATPGLLFVGRLVEKKGCEYLLKAMAILQKSFPDLKLTIAGEGGLKPALQEEAQSLPINVEFIGSQSPTQVRDLLAQCWVFVAPSITANNGDSEGLGMVFLEAQALETPVVSYRSGGLVEAVEEGKTALLCEEKDVNALADNIATLVADEQLRRSMGAAGRKRVEEQFNVHRQCAALEKIYNDML